MKLVFDYDGTLFESASAYVPAFHSVCAFIEQQGLQVARQLSDEEIGYWIGISSKELWNQVCPSLDEDLKARCSALLGSEMQRIVSAGQAHLYPCIPETLSALQSNGHTLVFLSNCHHRYMETHREAFGLDRWFSAFYCCEDYSWAPKADVFGRVVDDLDGTGADLGSYVVIGDRFHDMEIARVHGVAGVGCAYGYGNAEELEHARVIAHAPHDLLGVLEQLCTASA